MGVVNRIRRWIVQHVDLISNVAWWAWSLGGGLLSGWAAHVADIFPRYAPFSWVAAGLIGMAVTAFIAACIGWLRARIYEARLYQIASVAKPPFNRLEQQFTKQVISITDLIHPLGEPISAKTFIDCEFYGPGILALSAASFDGFWGNGTEFATAKEGEAKKLLPNKAIITQSHLIRCKFYNMVVMMTEKSVTDLEEKLQQKLPRL
jgi:hypothetical protein